MKSSFISPEVGPDIAATSLKIAFKNSPPTGHIRIPGLLGLSLEFQESSVLTRSTRASFLPTPPFPIPLSHRSTSLPQFLFLLMSLLNVLLFSMSLSCPFCVPIASPAQFPTLRRGLIVPPQRV